MTANFSASEPVWFGSGFSCLARAILLNGNYITQSTLSTIVRKIHDVTNPNLAEISSSVTISTSVFDTLQTPSYWTDKVDDIGFNFQDIVSHSALVNSSRTYHIEYILTPTSGEPVVIVFEIESKDPAIL